MKKTLSRLLAITLMMAVTLVPPPAFAEDEPATQEPEITEDITAEGVDTEVSEADFDLLDGDNEGYIEDMTEEITEEITEDVPVEEPEPTEPEAAPAPDTPAEPETEPKESTETAEAPTEPVTEPEATEPSEESTEAVTAETVASEDMSEEVSPEDVAVAEDAVSENVDAAPAENTPDIALLEAAPSGEQVVADTADTAAKMEAAPAPAAVAAEAAGIPVQVVRNRSVLYLTKGDVIQLAVEGRVIKGCKSAKRKVASASKTGLVTAKKQGKTKITVKLKGKGRKKITVTVKVTDPTIPKSVAITNGRVITMYKGETLQLNAVLAPATATSWLRWKSSKRKVATVNANGVVYARKKGKTKITVRARNKKKYTVTVKVLKGMRPVVPTPQPQQVTQEFIDQAVAAQIRQTNEERAKIGRAALEIDPDLMASAKVRAQEITVKWGHDRPDGSSCKTASPSKYCYPGTDLPNTAENIAINYIAATPEETAALVTTRWVNSAGHYLNIKNGRNLRIGVAAVLGTYYGRPALYWVQTFAGMTTDEILAWEAEQKRKQQAENMEKLRQAPIGERINQFSIAINGKSPEEAKALMTEYNLTIEDIEKYGSDWTLIDLGYKTYPSSGELLKRVRDEIDHLEECAQRYSQYINTNPEYAADAMQNVITSVAYNPGITFEDLRNYCHDGMYVLILKTLGKTTDPVTGDPIA